jgi:S-adenosylmethionine:tRNA-ribosyltransferase-isomerase (queuine synthetase)
LKKGTCCGVCNDTKVIPARLMLMMGGGKWENS